MKRLVGALLLVLAAALPALAEGMYSGVGTLYARDESGSYRMVCTASAVDNGGTVEIWTAAHCVSWAMQKIQSSGTAGALSWWLPTGFDVASISKPAQPNEKWASLFDFYVEFEGLGMRRARVMEVGKEAEGFDFAILSADTAGTTPLVVGSWEDVQQGDDVVNPANPMGLGLQLFRGYISMLSLERPIVALYQSINWRQNFIMSVPSAGGSSGSLILKDGKVIGILVGVIQDRFGAPFTVGVPLWKIKKARAEGNVIRPANPGD